MNCVRFNRENLLTTKRRTTNKSFRKISILDVKADNISKYILISGVCKIKISEIVDVIAVHCCASSLSRVCVMFCEGVCGIWKRSGRVCQEFEGCKMKKVLWDSK
jgi:hypothetical protein